MAYNEYSLPDTRTVLYHPDAGAASLYRGDAAESPGQGFRPTGTHPVYPLPAIAITEQRKGKGTADCAPFLS